MKKNNVIAVINNKGGVGKTTCTAGLSIALAEQGFKILAIDTDPQGNLSRLFGFEPKEERQETLYHCINNVLKSGEYETSNFILDTDDKNIDLLVGDINLTANRIEVERALTKFNFIYKKIIESIKKDEKYDFIIFDTCPSLGAENSQILVAAEYIIIPSTTGRNSVEGIDQLIDFYNSCKEVNSSLKMIGILLNNVNVNSSVSKDIIPMLRETYSGYMFNTIVERSVAAEKMEWTGMKPSKNKIYNAFIDIAKEVLIKIGK